MFQVNVYEAKTNFSHYLDLVQKGKRVIIAKRNIPIAKISPIKREVPKRAIGQSRVKFEIPEEFFKPLPKSVIDSFTNPK